MVAVLIAGFSPIPYKVFTIAAGVLSMALLPFAVASFFGRGARFFLVAGLMRWGGARMEAQLRRHIDMIGWASVALVAVGAAALLRPALTASGAPQRSARSDQRFNGLRIHAVFLAEHPAGQRIGRVARQHRHHRLRQDGPVIKLGRDRCTVAPAKRHPASMARWWVCKPGERGQQTGVDVDQAPFVVRHKTRREDAHEPGQHHQRR